MLYDRNIIGTSSEIFVYLRQSSGNVRRRSSSLWNNFGKSSEIFRKWSEIFGKSSKTSLLVCLYNKQNNTWTLGDMEFIFSCSHSISHPFASLTRSISMWTLEDKFHISARPCIILYFQLLYSWRFSRHSTPIHWLVHGHMTSNNETVSRQMPGAGNIAKTMTSSRKQFSVTREMLTAVARNLPKRDHLFSTGLTHLFCYITNHLMTGPLGNKIHCFPRDYH